MGAIRYTMKNGEYILADDCHVTPDDGVEELDCTVYLFNLLRDNGFYKIGQVAEQPGMTFFNLNRMSMKYLRELFTRLDFLGFRLADWDREQSVDEYYSVYKAANERRLAEERAQLEEEIRVERRERARLRARERRVRQKLQQTGQEM